MIVSTSHLKYGKALYNAAKNAQVEDKVLNDMEELTHAFSNEVLRKLMISVGYIATSAQEKVLNATFHGKIQDITMNLLILMAQAKKISLMPQVAEIYRKIFHEMKGIQAVTIRSARKLAPEETQKLMKSLEEKMAKSLDVRFEEDPSLIGGVQIFEGSKLSDYSVKNYLETLKKHLLSH
jgi:F-type H+-transporting ATPase subunit delta